jgi:hypothetical protein
MYRDQPNPSTEHAHLSGRNIRKFDNFNIKDRRELRRLGIFLDESDLTKIHKAHLALRKKGIMDAIQPSVTTGSIDVPLQFLQTWMPGFVYIATAPRKIDVLIGLTTIGKWDDEEIVQGTMELLGGSVPYGDYTNTPFSSWNVNWEHRTNVPFEEGMQVGNREASRSARINVDTARQKREAAMLVLDIRRNSIGFNGFNNGANRTYGFFNDPGLPSYVAVANGASGSPLWSRKTFLEIQRDILTGFSTLRNQSKDLIDSKTTPCTLAVASDSVDYLSTTSEFGESVGEWLRENYPKCRVESAPELTDANGGASVFYLYADVIDDSSTDGGRVWQQNVPAKFQLNGVARYEKRYVESYSNATAGAMLKRPYAVTRFTGI